MATFVGIVGSRKRSSLGDRKIVCQIVDTCVKKYGEIVIVSGGAKGPDSFAEDAAKIFSIPTVIFPVPQDPPIENKHDFRKRAMARNTLIAEKADVLFALVDPSRRGGTEDTIKKALARGKKVITVDNLGNYYVSPK